jgi:hypothetical protein
MLPWLIRAAQGYVAFDRDCLQADSVINLAEEGKLDQAEARLRLFPDLDEDWQVAARLILAWLGKDHHNAALLAFERVAKSTPLRNPLPLLRDRVEAALAGEAKFSFEEETPLSLDVGQELVKRVSGQEFDREMLDSVNPSLITKLGSQSKIINQRGYASTLDAPILVNIARDFDVEGTALLDAYTQAHAGYNYVVYRNRSLWILLEAVLRHHPKQEWVKQRLRLILASALTGGGVVFNEMLPLTANVLLRQADPRWGHMADNEWCSAALNSADKLQHRRGADDSWGTHKRRLTAFMELKTLVFDDRPAATKLLDRIVALPGGFAGFQAPAYLRLADAVRACGVGRPGLREELVAQSLRVAHRIQDYHFCARVTARCNALKRWHERHLKAQELTDTVRHLASSPGSSEFAADHVIHEPYGGRDDDDPDVAHRECAKS